MNSLPPLPGDVSMKSEMDRLLGSLPPDVRRAFQGYAESHTYPVFGLFAELLAALAAEPGRATALAASLERLHMGIDLSAHRARGFLDPRLEPSLQFVSLRLVATAAAELALDDPAEVANVFSWKYFGARPQDVATFDAYCLVWPSFYGQVYKLLGRAVGSRLKLDDRGRSALETGLAHLGCATHLANASLAFRQPSGLGKSGAEMLLVAILEESTEFEAKSVRKYIASLRGNFQFLGDREYARIRSVAKRHGVFEKLTRRIAADTAVATEALKSLVPNPGPALLRIFEYPATVNPGAPR